MENSQNVKSQEKSKITEQKILIENRKKITINGVEKLISIKDELLQVQTSEGVLIVNGSGLQIEKLDLDASMLVVDGNIDGMKFAGVKEPFLKRIFK